MPTVSSVSSTKVVSVLVLTTFLWGGSFVFNKLGFRDVPPVTFLFFRFSLATVIMLIFCLPRIRSFTRDIVTRGMIVGVALAAANLSFVFGVAGTSVSRAGFLNNLFVLIIPLLCFVLWREKITRWNVAGIMLAMAGLWELARGSAEGFSRGDFFSTICAVFISLHIILVSRVLRDEDVYLVTLVQFATVAAVGAVLYVLIPAPPAVFSPVSVAALLYCAIFPTVVCFTLQNSYQRYTTPTQAGLIYTLDPVWSMLGGMLVLGERLSVREWVGCTFIFAAVIVPLLARRLQERRYRAALELPEAPFTSP